MDHDSTTFDHNSIANSTTTYMAGEAVLVEPNAPPFPRLELISRRAWTARVLGATLVGGTALAGGTMMYFDHQKEQQQLEKKKNSKPKVKKIAPINVTQVARETGVNITVLEEGRGRAIITLDSQTFQKNRQFAGLPGWLPPYLTPHPKVVKDIPNSELLTAAIVAGSAVEMMRTALLYPLQTLKARIQSDSHHHYARRRRRSSSSSYSLLKRRLRRLQLNAVRHVREGNLYAGLLPSLLVSVPATGVYYGARDITKRMLLMSGGSSAAGTSDLVLALTAAFVADVISLVFRTPADTLALRLQVASAQEDVLPRDDGDEDVGDVVDNEIAQQLADALEEARIEKEVGNWFVESLERLPAAILTDLPYLLSRIAVNGVILQSSSGSSIDIGHYEIATLCSAVLCAFLTTPFDVARTRILVDSDADPSNGVDGGSVVVKKGADGLLATFRAVMKEGEGGIGNLFAGWLERTAYLGISSLWLPFALVFYVAIRDAILLEWFD